MSAHFLSPIVRRGLVHSLRFELVFVLLFGTVFPLLALTFLEGGRFVSFDIAANWIAQPGVANSFIGSVLCGIVSIIILRRLRYYPGVAVARSILPVLALMFSLLIGVIAGLRLEYYNKLLLLCFLGIFTTRFAITAMRSRAKGLLYYLVPGGRVDIISQLRSAPVITLKSPSLEGLPDCAIVADLHADIGDEWERFLADAAISGRPVYHYKHVWEAETGTVQIDHLSENSFGALVPGFAYQKIKRAVDLVLVVGALPIAIPLLGVCAIMIKRDSAGPVFFRQRRMGFRGEEFEVLKLRTMSQGHNGKNRNLSITKSADQRITKVGAFLRHTRLDELPQIYNIVRGEMSWIGPRPETVSLSEWYESEIPFYRYRHMVRPGISGWAQVNQGHVAEVGEVDEKLQYDFYYVKNLSYWLDIIIALRTVKVVLSGFGAK
ncbi:sugar transferase [Qipengyuania huizhouensis]|uniref:sugar transferase n=1 Tax=Qipengyuania huizhouensis TaxID=2867245 RepID=UPI001C87AEFA|nr:sugar transferase [Qipengyuania huizhouensis]MBX7460372.1 sugar transferase [Qipengyuania huizhouensis]